MSAPTLAVLGFAECQKGGLLRKTECTTLTSTQKHFHRQSLQRHLSLFIFHVGELPSLWLCHHYTAWLATVPAHTIELQY